MKFKIKMLLLAVELSYLVFILVTHFFLIYDIPTYLTGLLGFFSHSIRWIILLVIFYFFPDPAKHNKSIEQLKKERNILVSILIIGFLLILILSFFNGY